MRKGLNPNKDKMGKNDVNYVHQIIIPVYIPELDGYFSESLKIFQTCIKSLLKSINKNTFISLVSNGSCTEVEEYVKGLYIDGMVQEITLTSNIGKYNSIMKAFAGHSIPLVTISDADVYFLDGWQNETFKVFRHFDRAGTVGLIPQFLSYQSQCENLLFDYNFSPDLRFEGINDSEGLIEFYKSIGWKPDYPEDRLKYTLCLRKNEHKAIVGSGHVVATYRRELLEGLQLYNSYKMGGNSEKLLDETAPKKGYYRFTTSKNMAFHLGNKLDNKLIGKINQRNNKLVITNESFPELPAFVNSDSKVLYFIKKRIIQLILKSHKLRMLYLKQLGLPKTARKSF